jgi:hypothetical protein
MWNIEDKNGFEIETSNNRGQINLDQDLGKVIFELSKEIENTTFVDIGTWNGLGSTKCFIEAMKLNKSSKLYTIENNKEKFEVAKSLWQDVIKDEELNVVFLNGTLVENELIDSWIEENNILLTDQQKYWLHIDKQNSTNLVNIDCDSIDILLIDGSEYTGYLELILLKDKCKYILLDDVRSVKNEMSRNYLLSSPDFILISEDLYSRNGYSVFKKK